jgi:hypothetical protein
VFRKNLFCSLKKTWAMTGRKSQSITYKTWMSLHLLSQIDADRWGVQQTLNCYFLFQTQKTSFSKENQNVVIGSTAVGRFQCRINHYWN